MALGSSISIFYSLIWDSDSVSRIDLLLRALVPQVVKISFSLKIFNFSVFWFFSEFHNDVPLSLSRTWRWNQISKNSKISKNYNFHAFKIRKFHFEKNKSSHSRWILIITNSFEAHTDPDPSKNKLKVKFTRSNHL